MGSEPVYPRKETFALSLRVWHPTIDAQDIAESIGIPAKRICRRGEPRQTPKGKALKGVYPDNYYVGDVIRRDEFDTPEFDNQLTACINLALARVSPFKEALLRLKAAGARSEFFIGWKIRGNAGLELEPKLMSQLADLGISLSIDVYGKSTQSEQ